MKRFADVSVAAALLLGAAGCAVLPGVGTDAGEMARSAAKAFDTRPVPATLAPAPRPNYARGDTFIYGATTVRSVRTANAKGVEWSTQHNEVQRGSRDFFAPFHLYETPVARIDSEISGDPGKLWPLQVGNKVSFEESRRVTWKKTGHSKTQTLRWECEVVDMRMSYVPAGDFPQLPLGLPQLLPGLLPAGEYHYLGLCAVHRPLCAALVDGRPAPAHDGAVGCAARQGGHACAHRRRARTSGRRSPAGLKLRTAVRAPHAFSGRQR